MMAQQEKKKKVPHEWKAIASLVEWMGWICGRSTKTSLAVLINYVGKQSLPESLAMTLSVASQCIPACVGGWPSQWTRHPVLKRGDHDGGHFCRSARQARETINKNSVWLDGTGPNAFADAIATDKHTNPEAQRHTKCRLRQMPKCKPIKETGKRDEWEEEEDTERWTTRSSWSSASHQ